MKKDKDVKIKLNNGKEVETSIEVKLVYDSNYGADADGNKGFPITFIEDVFILPFETDLNGNILSKDEIIEAEELFDNEIDLIEWEKE